MTRTATATQFVGAPDLLELRETEHFTVEANPDRATWLASARRSVGASEAAVMWGESPYDSLVSLWGKKTGIDVGSEDDAEWLLVGQLLEEPIAQLVALRTGRTLVNWGAFTRLRSKRWPWMTCTLDRVQLIDDALGMVDCKNRGAFTHEDWTAGPPLAIATQIQHQLAVTGWHFGTVGALFGGQRPEVYDLERDDEWIEMHAERCRLFMESVEQRIAPDFDGSAHTIKALRRWQPPLGEVLDLPAEAAEWASAVQDARQAAKVAKDAAEAATAQLMYGLILGGATAGRLPDGRLITLSTETVQEHTVKEFSKKVLRVKNPPKKRSSK